MSVTPLRKKSLVDTYVGNRLRMLRKMRQLSQAKLGQLMKLSHQQIQQYESGISRISAGTLYELTLLLDVPITYFYEGVEHLSVLVDSNKSQCFEREQALDVLLIENNAHDEMRFREALHACKKDTNIHVERSDADALEFLRGRRSSHLFLRPEIIVLGANAAQKDKYTVLKDIKKDRDLLSIPVIILTSGMDYDQVSQAFNRHASGFIKKSTSAVQYTENIELIVQYWSSSILPSMEMAR